MQAIFDYSEQTNQAGNAITFWFKPASKLRYVAGQFVELTIPNDKADERGIKRWFTISSSPTSQLIGITTKLANLSSTFKTDLANLVRGDTVNMSEAMGDFVLPRNAEIPLLFVAAGIGVTPMYSMIGWLTAQSEVRTITLLYAERDSTQLSFVPMFDEYLGDKFVRVLNKKITATLISSYINQDNMLVYIAGPEQLVEVLEKDLLSFGLPANRLILDFFPGYSN